MLMISIPSKSCTKYTAFNVSDVFLKVTKLSLRCAPVIGQDFILNWLSSIAITAAAYFRNWSI